MMKLIAVCGATGGMGGAVVAGMLKEGGWKVRAITRNANGEQAQALKANGAEVVAASYDDVESMVQAFNGATAIFAITNFWIHIAALGAAGASEKETEEILNIAEAAAQVTTLEHFVVHSLPSGEKVAGKGYGVPHTDSKDRAVEEIKRWMPELAKKSTFLWVGSFTQNMWSRPFMKPFEMPAARGKYLWTLPISRDTKVSFAGDAYHNVGVVVRAILARPQVSLPGRYVFVATDELTMPEALGAWSEVTGKPAVFASVSLEGFAKFYGPFGHEVGLQYRMHEMEPDMTKGYEAEFVTLEQLGVKAEELIGHEEALQRNSDKLL